MRIAILDNDRNQAELICQVLASARHACRPLQSGAAVLEHLAHEGCDLLIIDWRVADLNGADIIRTARDRLPKLPVLFLTSRFGEDDIVAAMTAGANDYLIKPIRRGELLTRVQALLKRTYPEYGAAEQVRFGRYAFEALTGRVTMADSAIDLTQKEFALAMLFFRHLDRPLSRAFIRESIWPREGDIPSRTVDTHVSRVRSKLGLRPENGFRLIPVYSYGYRLEKLPE